MFGTKNNNLLTGNKPESSVARKNIHDSEHPKLVLFLEISPSFVEIFDD